MTARLLCKQGVRGSIPLTSTNLFHNLQEIREDFVTTIVPKPIRVSAPSSLRSCASARTISQLS
jgi:hypothetical protein